MSDRKKFVGFFSDLDEVVFEGQRKVLTSAVNENDTRVTKGMKKLYANCVSSGYVLENGVKNIRKYLKTDGLNFYPEANTPEFDVAKYFEKEPQQALHLFLNTKLVRDRVDDVLVTKGLLLSTYYDSYTQKERLNSYKDMLYEMNQVYRNGSHSDEFKKEFSDIVDKQLEFFELLVCGKYSKYFLD